MRTRAKLRGQVGLAVVSHVYHGEIVPITLGVPRSEEDIQDIQRKYPKDVWATFRFPDGRAQDFPFNDAFLWIFEGKRGEILGFSISSKISPKQIGRARRILEALSADPQRVLKEFWQLLESPEETEEAFIEQLERAGLLSQLYSLCCGVTGEEVFRALCKVEIEVRNLESLLEALSD